MAAVAEVLPQPVAQDLSVTLGELIQFFRVMLRELKRSGGLPTALKARTQALSVVALLLGLEILAQQDSTDNAGDPLEVLGSWIMGQAFAQPTAE